MQKPNFVKYLFCRNFLTHQIQAIANKTLRKYSIYAAVYDVKMYSKALIIVNK